MVDEGRNKKKIKNGHPEHRRLAMNIYIYIYNLPLIRHLVLSSAYIFNKEKTGKKEVLESKTYHKELQDANCLENKTLLSALCSSAGPREQKVRPSFFLASPHGVYDVHQPIFT